MCGLLCSPAVPPSLSMCECGATLRGLLAAAWPAPIHNPPPHWVRQLPPCRATSPPWLPVSAPPTGLNVCFFFISLVGDFLAVRFSVSSGCVRRRSVSTSAATLVLSNCSLFQCLWLYFACLFVLLIRFQLKVRSYGICPHLLAYFTEHNAFQFHPCCHKG